VVGSASGGPRGHGPVDGSYLVRLSNGRSGGDGSGATFSSVGIVRDDGGGGGGNDGGGAATGF
jgi:hypothetical protein